MENNVNSTKYNLILAICIIVIIGSITMIAIIYSLNRSEIEHFDYSEHQNSTVLTIDDYKFSLHEISYYIVKMEAHVDIGAHAYNEDKPAEYWKLYLNDGFIKDVIKEATINLVIRDYIYANEALKLGLSPDEERLDRLSDETYETLKNMTGPQMEATNYTTKELYDVLYRIALAELYVNHISEQNPNLTEVDFDPNGDYYKQIIPNYKVKINNKIWDKVDMGHISINTKK